MSEEENAKLTGPYPLPQALSIGLHLMRERLPADVILDALDELIRHPERALQRQKELAYWIDKRIQWFVWLQGGELREFIERELADPEERELMLHIAVRWWLARDAFLSAPADQGFVKMLHVNGTHDDRDLLSRLLYNGADAPDKSLVPLPPGPSSPQRSPA